jgi:hypothetical protein
MIVRKLRRLIVGQSRDLEDALGMFHHKRVLSPCSAHPVPVLPRSEGLCTRSWIALAPEFETTGRIYVRRINYWVEVLSLVAVFFPFLSLQLAHSKIFYKPTTSDNATPFPAVHKSQTGQTAHKLTSTKMLRQTCV